MTGLGHRVLIASQDEDAEGWEYATLDGDGVSGVRGRGAWRHRDHLGRSCCSMACGPCRFITAEKALACTPSGTGRPGPASGIDYLATLVLDSSKEVHIAAA